MLDAAPNPLLLNALMEALEVVAVLAELRSRVRSQIIEFNKPERMREDASCHALATCRDLARQTSKAASNASWNMSRDWAREALALLEVVMATYHRHARFLQEDAAVDEPAFGRDFMLLVFRLGELGEHPPRGSHKVMWTDDSLVAPILYTDHPDERRFAWLTRRTDAVMKSLAKLALSIIHRELELTHASVPAAMLEFGERLKALRQEYSLFRTYDSPPEHDYQDRWFLHFRQFLAPISIGARRVRGPNPANVASWPEVDILFGLASEDYILAVKGRYRDFLPEDIYRIERALGMPTIPSVLTDFLNSESTATADQRQRVSAAFAYVTKQLKALSGAHWAAIVKYLVKPKPVQTRDGHELTFLSSGAGVSGRDLSETRALLDVRRADNEANTFVAQLQTVGSTN